MDTVALTYRRVSTYKQERQGTSLDDQLRTCREYVGRHQEWQLGHEFVDVLSGRTAKRRDYQALLQEVRDLRASGKGVVVVVAALDRMGRDLLESIVSRRELKALRVDLHCVREGGVLSETQANLLSTLAEDESERTAKRVRDSKAYTRARGFRPVGRVPWGYRLDEATVDERKLGAPRRVLRVDDVTAPFVVELFRRAADGASIRSLAAWVASLPSDARGGRSLDFQKVRDRLAAPVYVARPDEPKDVSVLDRPVGQWPALVDDDLWTRAQDALAAHAKQPKQGGDWLLGGLIRCPKDGLRMQGRRERWGPIYRCSMPFKGCYFYAKLDDVDALVLTEIERTLGPLTASPAILARLRTAWARLRKPERKARTARQVRALEQAIERATTRLRRAMDLLVDGTISKDDYDVATAGYRADADAARRELAEITATSAPPTLPDLDVVLDLLGGWESALSGLDMLAKRAILAPLVDATIPERIGRGRYDVEIVWTPLGKALRQLRSAVAAA